MHIAMYCVCVANMVSVFFLFCPPLNFMKTLPLTYHLSTSLPDHRQGMCVGGSITSK